MPLKTAPVRIIVEISRAEPFRGTISQRDQPPQAFNGWTAFAAAMAEVVRGIGSAGASKDAGDGEVGG